MYTISELIWLLYRPRLYRYLWACLAKLALGLRLVIVRPWVEICTWTDQVVFFIVEYNRSISVILFYKQSAI